MEEIDCSDRKNDTCNVRIVQNMNFSDIERQPSKTFVSWWPDAARSLIVGLYGDTDERRAAAHAILPILDAFPYKQLFELRMSSTVMMSLRELYSSRLMFEEQYIRMVKEHWSNQIQTIADKGRRLELDHNETCAELKSRANKLNSRYRGAQATIQSTLRDYMDRGTNEYKMKMRLLRSEMLEHQSIRRPETRQLDERIATLTREVEAQFGPETVRSIRMLYETHVGNIEHDVAEQIQEECRKSWILGLQ